MNIDIDNILDEVMTIKEIATKYPVADSTVRGWIMDNELNSNDIRKSQGTWLVKKQAIIKLLIDKKLYGRKFEMDDITIYVEHCLFKDENIEIWLTDDSAKRIFEKIEDSNLAIEALINYKKLICNHIKYVLIDDDLKKADNWLIRDSNVLAITALEFKRIVNLILKGKYSIKQNDKTVENRLIN